MAVDYLLQCYIRLLYILHLGSPTVDLDMGFLKQTEVTQFREVVEVKVGILEGAHMDVELNRFKARHSTWMKHQPGFRSEVPQFGECYRSNDMVAAGLVAAQSITKKL